MLLAILPDEESVDLTPHGFPGVTARVRPMDLEERGRWYAITGGQVDGPHAITTLVTMVLVAMDGLEMEGVETVRGEEKRTREVFNPRNPRHLRALPMRAMRPIYDHIIKQLELTEAAAGN